MFQPRFVLCGLFVFVGCAHAPTFQTKENEAILRVLHQQADAWNRGDLEVFMEGYSRSPELVFTSGGKVRRGWQAATDRYRKAYTDKKAMGALRFSDLEISPLGPDAAMVLGRWMLTDTPKTGGGVFTLIMRREAEGWRVWHDHTSLDPRTRP